MYCKLSSFLVVGTKKSGLSACKLLLSKGAKTYFYDDNPTEQALKNQEELINLGAIKLDNESNLVDKADILVLSPAVPIDSEIAVKFKNAGKRIIGELELGAYFITSPIVAVTGTNGKTSVCSIISHALTVNNVNNELVGNIGVPITSKLNAIKPDTIVVTEVSSFQLETTAKFSPHISCVLNVTEDHLNRHYTLENYAFVKSKIVMNLRESEFAVLNYDDEIVKEFENKTRGVCVWFSTKNIVDGAYLEGEELKYKGEVIVNKNEVNLTGEHNLSDLLSSICVLKLLGLNASQIKKGLTTFQGVKHRIEKVGVRNGVTFYNDSKATNVDATIKAVNTMEKPTVLILGGYDKGLNYSELFKVIKNNDKIKKVVLTGASSKNMFEQAIKVGVSEVSVIKDFTLAIRVAYRLCENDYNVLLSPSTSSFDEFSGYEERGEKFIEVVNSL